MENSSCCYSFVWKYFFATCLHQMKYFGSICFNLSHLTIVVTGCADLLLLKRLAKFVAEDTLIFFLFFRENKSWHCIHVSCLPQVRFFFYWCICPITFIHQDLWYGKLVPIVLSTSLGKTFFVWHFILNENILFQLSICYQKPFAFSVSVLCSQIFTVKLNLWSDLYMQFLQ